MTATVSPWAGGIVPEGAISGRATTRAWAAERRRRRRVHRLELVAAGLAGAAVTLLAVLLERRVFGG